MVSALVQIENPATKFVSNPRFVTLGSLDKEADEAVIQIAFNWQDAANFGFARSDAVVHRHYDEDGDESRTNFLVYPKGTKPTLVNVDPVLPPIQNLNLGFDEPDPVEVKTAVAGLLASFGITPEEEEEAIPVPPPPAAPAPPIFDEDDEEEEDEISLTPGRQIELVNASNRYPFFGQLYGLASRTDNETVLKQLWQDLHDGSLVIPEKASPRLEGKTNRLFLINVMRKLPTPIRRAPAGTLVTQKNDWAEFNPLWKFLG